MGGISDFLALNGFSGLESTTNVGLGTVIPHYGLKVYDSNQASMDEIGRGINVQVQDGWIPIHPKLGVEYDQVLDDVVSQLKAIAKIAGVHLSQE